jgi:glycerate 2-kinase
MAKWITNRKMLGTTKMRRDAMAIFEAGLTAVDTQSAVLAQLSLKRDVLSIGRKKYDLKKFNRVMVVGIGKASGQAAMALEKLLGDRISGGVVVDVKRCSLKRIKVVAGTHPLPSKKNIRATGEIMGLLKGLDSKDLLITIISGGGSALMCMPYSLECDEMQEVTSVLMKKGADIHELNTVRKHLSEIKGGQFARMAHPAKILSLVFSDVPGDDLSMIASGPTVLDQTTVADAKKVLKKHKMSVKGLHETPKDPVLFRHVHNVILVSNSIATEAMAEKAGKLGYASTILSNELEGEAREVGEFLAKNTSAGEALIAAGETTVTVTRPGKGGRNQELSLGAMDHLEEKHLVASFASDGIDHTPIAGGMADEVAIERAEKKGLSAKRALEMNQSYDFFMKTRSYMRTGMTGINVSDLMLSIRKK